MKRFNTVEQAVFEFLKVGVDPLELDSPPTKPNEFIEIIWVIYRLYRKRELTIDQVRVMAYYGHKGYAPDAYKWKQAHAADLWNKAMRTIERPLFNEGLISQLKYSL